MTSSLIAYRGLWDRFAAPRSAEAIRRSLSRGIPTLVHIGGSLSAGNALALVSDAGVNRRQQPAYLVTCEPPRIGLGIPEVPSWLQLFVIEAAGPAGTTYPIWRSCEDGWSLAGCYLPIEASRRGLAAQDFLGESRVRSLVVYESANVIQDIAESARLDPGYDDTISASIQALTGPYITIARVSDLVELDLMNRQIREAA